MMHLTGITIRNFKSIGDAEVHHLAPINVFFGPTNSGKTSMLEAVYFQFNHQRITAPDGYNEFLHSRANPDDAELVLETSWEILESIPNVNLRPKDTVRCLTRIVYHHQRAKAEDQLFINGTAEEQAERKLEIFLHFRRSIKFSSSRRPGDSKKGYYPASDETNDVRARRFLSVLQELELQGAQYHEFLSRLQRMFPHLVYGADSKASILEFFGMGFLGTAKLFLYLYDARYPVVLIDEPEIHFYPSLVRRFVQTLHEVQASLQKQMFIATHATIFLHERRLGNFYHITKSRHYHTAVRQVEQGNLLQGIDLLNAPAESILQSDMVIYVEGPWDVGVLEEFLDKFPELAYVNIIVLQLGGGSMGNVNVDPVKLKMHNPLSFVLIDSERASKDAAPDPAHQTFLNRCVEAKLSCRMLERQAIENYFTPRALRAVFGNKIPTKYDVRPYAPLQSQGLRWYEKESNRAVARAMTRDEIEAAPDLQAFFRELIEVSRQVQ